MFIVKVPGINNGNENAGCSKAGNLILNELRKIKINEQGKIVDADMLDLEEIHLNNSDLKLTNKLIYENSLEIFESKPKTIFLGGDHSISYSIGEAFLDYCKNSGKEPCLIVFDSHPECVSDEEEFPKNKTWLRKLAESGFPRENILLVGVRNSEHEENIFLKKERIQVMSTSHILEEIHEACDTIMEFSSNKELYVSLDMGIVDPAFAPGVLENEPGGLSSREILYLVQRINKIKNLKAFDIVGINPELDRDNLTIKLGAKILSELL